MNFAVDIPFTRMGNVTSEDLLEAREQELFAFYKRHRNRYGRVLDVGANIGVHTVRMARLGWDVHAFEPDPEHFSRLLANVRRNEVDVSVYPYALSTVTRDVEFVRVLGNTTANHIAGARTFYGPSETVKVKAVEAAPYFKAADFAKVDVEGHEADLLTSLPSDIACEIMVEIGSPENAGRIYSHFRGRAMWAQRSGWGLVMTVRDVPTHYKEGALFIGSAP